MTFPSLPPKLGSPAIPAHQIEILSEGSTTVVVLKGQLHDALSSADRDLILSSIQPGGQLILDFTYAEDISGRALRRLLLLTRYVCGQGGGIASRGVSDRLRGIAEASGFLDLINRTVPAPIPFAQQAMRVRTDFYPTHVYEGYALRAGTALPLGATALPHGVNFAVYSRHATQCTLVLYHPGESAIRVEIPFLPEFRVGDVRAMMVFQLDPEEFEYGIRMQGPFEPHNGQRFDRQRVLLDPVAPAVVWRTEWGRKDESFMTPRGKLIPQDFDWEGDRPLGLPLAELVIYETHVRGFTRHHSAAVRFPGTYAGLRDKIPYLAKLGVNCVELMPIFEFDETELDRANPITGEPLVNYWGYSTVGFYAPKASYAATGNVHLQADEFKTLVKELHRNGIEVILDVVFNHTSEGAEDGPTLSFKGLDNSTYYMLTPEGRYYDFSGCGNTLNCNHPVVRDFVLNCLRYWVSEYHIDGFRFDLASILGRSADGTPLANPPLIESLAHDPVLARTKLIAEAWDAGGLYQVGNFPAYGRWAEWNGKYRDCIRRFVKGDSGQVVEMAQRLCGSPDLYQHRGPSASINFVTCHDGFTLADVVSYNEKHNEANGEANRDGADENYSWNCGIEGHTDDPNVLSLRRRQMKNALAMLFLSQGVPMLLMGDELGRSQLGNNNSYCHDTELNWLDWSLIQKNEDLLRFVQALIAFRKLHPALRNMYFANSGNREGSRLEIAWHGTHLGQPDWSDSSRSIGMQVRLQRDDLDDQIYACFNMYWESLTFELPVLEFGNEWRLFANTGSASPSDIASPGKESKLENQMDIPVRARSVVILVAKPNCVSEDR